MLALCCFSEFLVTLLTKWLEIQFGNLIAIELLLTMDTHRSIVSFLIEFDSVFAGECSLESFSRLLIDILDLQACEIM